MIAITTQWIIDYIFSALPNKKVVLYEEIERFQKTFYNYLKRYNPELNGCYYECTRDLSETNYDGFLVKRKDGIYLYGESLRDASFMAENTYGHLKKYDYALNEALSALS